MYWSLATGAAMCALAAAMFKTVFFQKQTPVPLMRPIPDMDSSILEDLRCAAVLQGLLAPAAPYR